MNLFDLSLFEAHRKLFGSSDKPWEWLKNLDGYLRTHETNRSPDAIVHASTMIDSSTGPIVIEAGAMVQFGAVIRGPAYIGKGSIVGYNAFVTGVLLVEDCVIGFSTQAVRSIFLSGSRAPHLNYVGDSVIGRCVNLGAGVKIGNLPLDEDGDVTLMWGGQRIDTGQRKFGALIGNDTKIGCNCVLNPGTVIGANSRVYGSANVSGTWPEMSRLRPMNAELRRTEQRRKK